MKVKLPFLQKARIRLYLYPALKENKIVIGWLIPGNKALYTTGVDSVKKLKKFVHSSTKYINAKQKFTAVSRGFVISNRMASIFTTSIYK